MILTDDEVILEKNNHFYEDRYGETFNFLDFARAIEAAILKKIGEPVGWLDAEYSQAYTVTELADAEGTGFVPLYALPEVKE